MGKSTVTYWNTLADEAQDSWSPVAGIEGLAEESTLSIDEETGEYTRLTRFLPGADTTDQPAKRPGDPPGYSKSRLKE